MQDNISEPKEYISPTALRGDVFNIIDEVINTGIPKCIKRNGQEVYLVPAPNTKVSKYEAFREYIENSPTPWVSKGISENIDAILEENAQEMMKEWEEKWDKELENN
jgi:PHD/YefM family antitoxin component YafN of YafNO toxin-antitoxin module